MSLFSICDAPKASWRAETQRQNVASEANVASKIMWREGELSMRFNQSTFLKQSHLLIIVFSFNQAFDILFYSGSYVLINMSSCFITVSTCKHNPLFESTFFV